MPSDAMLQPLLPPIDTIAPFFTGQQRVAAHTVLLPLGQVCAHLYIVVQGCVRIYVQADRRVITNDFFLENDPAGSLDSFLSSEPSQYALETLEPSTLLVLARPEFDRLMAEEPVFQHWFNTLVMTRFLRLSRRLLTHLCHKPQRRYNDLLRLEPHLLQRVPLHYLASYLGITRVSLSRIRARVGTGIL